MYEDLIAIEVKFMLPIYYITELLHLKSKPCTCKEFFYLLLSVLLASYGAAKVMRFSNLK